MSGIPYIYPMFWGSTIHLKMWAYLTKITNITDFGHKNTCWDASRSINTSLSYEICHLWLPYTDNPKSVITNIVACTNCKWQVSENWWKSAWTTIGWGVGVILQKGKHCKISPKIESHVALFVSLYSYRCPLSRDIKISTMWKE